jgi:hypothetical protein
VFKSYASSFGSDYPKDGFCPFANYVMIGIVILCAHARTHARTPTATRAGRHART